MTLNMASKHVGFEVSAMRPSGYEPAFQPYYSDTYHRPLNIAQFKFFVLTAEYMEVYVYTNVGLTDKIDKTSFFQNVTM